MCGWHVYRLCVRMEEMKLEVDCYSGRTADERPIRFRLETATNIWSRRYWTSGTGRRIPFTKSMPMTAISISCAERRRRPMDLGIWSHSVNCRAEVDWKNTKN